MIGPNRLRVALYVVGKFCREENLAKKSKSRKSTRCEGVELAFTIQRIARICGRAFAWKGAVERECWERRRLRTAREKEQGRKKHRNVTEQSKGVTRVSYDRDG